MRVLVSGSRWYSDYHKILSVISSLDIDLLISGACRGADTLAVRAARQCGIRYIEYPADWQRFGKSAGLSEISACWIWKSLIWFCSSMKTWQEVEAL